MISASPRADASMASVTMNGAIRPYAMSSPLTRPQAPPTASATSTMTIQWVSSAIVWVASVVAQTEASATIAPTDRSIPPPVMTKVMPMLTTPMTDARRRIVSMLSTLRNLSPAVQPADADQDHQGDDQAEVAPDRAVHDPGERRTGVGGLDGCCLDPALLVRRWWRGRVCGGLRVAHATRPSMTRSRTRCSSMSAAGPSWTTRPSLMTRTRSESPSTSSTSLDTTTTATPSSASRRIRP